MIPVWTYWQGPMPGWIEICLRTLTRHIPELHVLTPQTWPTWRRDDHGQKLDRQKPNIISDYIRGHQLYHFGGIWIDADCIAFRDVRPIFQRLQRHDFVAYRVGLPEPQLCSALIASQAGGIVATEYLRLLDQRLNNLQQGHLPRLSLGPNLLKLAKNNVGKQPALIRTERVHPIHWRHKQRLWQEATDDEHAAAIDFGCDPFCCMLTHRALGPLRNLSADELLESRSLIGYLFRRSLT